MTELDFEVLGRRAQAMKIKIRDRRNERMALAFAYIATMGLTFFFGYCYMEQLLR
jgi:hypothetical protein